MRADIAPEGGEVVCLRERGRTGIESLSAKTNRIKDLFDISAAARSLENKAVWCLSSSQKQR